MIVTKEPIGTHAVYRGGKRVSEPMSANEAFNELLALVKKHGLAKKFEVKEIRANKFGAKRTEVDGITFDSKAEARFYHQLKLRQRAKDIAGFEMQRKFILLDPFVDNTGKKQPGISYTADFVIHHLDGSEEVIDVKGGNATKTKDYLLRRQLFLSRYREYKFSEEEVRA